jgi:hypothetical protein
MVTDRQGRNLLHLACSASCKKLKAPESVSVRMVNFLLDRGLDLESPLLVGELPSLDKEGWLRPSRKYR